MSVLFLPLASMLAACAMEPEMDVATTEEAGVSLNGVSLNGVSLNGVSLNGVSLNGVSLNGVSLNGVSLNGITLTASSFSGLNSSGQRIAGSQFVGTQWTGQLSSGSTIQMRIDSMTQGFGSNADVSMYGVSYLSGSTWSRLCGSDATTAAPILAIPVSGVWNYQKGVPGGGGFTADATRFTFGCRGTAIAKCVEMGYKPWKAASVAGGNLTNHHVSCTRLLRADYCGDGNTYTVNGTQVDIYDGLGIQTDTVVWPFEAEWTPSGARCMAPGTPTRVQLKLGLSVPACFAPRLSLSCGALSDFQTGTLLMSETGLI
jgi:hypothetical protein